jgi:hypothetical protein
VTSAPDEVGRMAVRGRGAAADRARLLRLMDLNLWEMYRAMARCAAGGEIRETDVLTLIAVPGAVAWNNLALVRGPLDVDALLAEVRDFYVERGRPFAVYVRAHADGAVEAALVRRGFQMLVTNPGMALLADPDTRCAPPGLVVLPALDDAGRRDYLRVTAEAYATYAQPRGVAESLYAVLESVSSPTVQGYVGYVGDEPVAAATLFHTHGVAGVGEVGTVPAHRGRRYAEAVTWRVVREGFRRGAGFANLQASPMGGPVYARMGFVTPTAYRVLVGPA